MLAAQPLKVPVMLVHSLWDQEDIYGAIAVYKAIEPKDTDNDKVFLVMGPWHHGQEIGDGSTLGALKFGSDTGALLPAEDPAPVPRPVPEGRRAEGGRRAGHRVRDRARTRGGGCPAWPAGCASGCTRQADAALSRRRLEAGFHRAEGRRRARSTSTSPIRPSRCRSAPGRFSPSATTTGYTWPQWLVDDQREASGPPGRAGLRLRRADRAGEDQRAAGRQPGRLDQRHRLRLGGEADRRLSRRSGRRSRRWAAIS